MAHQNDVQTGFAPMNTRAAAMWEMMQVIDWHDKTVLDVGCGAGDMLLYAAEAGASAVMGIDKDQDVIDVAHTRSMFNANITLICATIEDYLDQLMPSFDIIVCLSVLPYLKRSMYDVLSWIANHSTYAIIECQYYGDGPGIIWIEDDDDMGNVLLGTLFRKWIKLGYTTVEDREVERSLWLCE